MVSRRWGRNSAVVLGQDLHMVDTVDTVDTVHMDRTRLADTDTYFTPSGHCFTLPN